MFKTGRYFLIMALLAFAAACSASSAAVAEDFEALFERMSEAWPDVSYDGDPIDLRFSSPAPRSSIMHRIWQGGLEVLQRQARGSLRIRQFHSGTIHGPRHGFKAVRSANSDFATCYVSLNPHFFRLSNVWTLPGVAPEDPVAATRIALEIAPEYVRREFEGQDVYLGHQQVMPPATLMSREPIRSLEDIKGKKVGGTAGQVKIIEALGATLVPLDFPDYYVAMQRGMIDALIWFDAGFAAYKITEVAKYHTRTALGTGTLDYCIRREFYEELPADLQRLFYHYNQSMAVAEAYLSYSAILPWLEGEFTKHNIETIALSPVEADRWRRALQPVVDGWAARAEQDGLPARRMLSDIAARREKYRGWTAQQIIELTNGETVRGLIADREAAEGSRDNGY